MAENKVSVEITLEEKAALKALTQLTKEVQKTETGFTKLGKTGEDSLGIIGQAGQGASGAFKSLVGGVTIANLASSAIIGTANAVKDFVLGSVNAAIEQENAINKLNQALKASGDFSQRGSQDLINFASSLQQISIYGDEVVIGQLAVAKSFGATNEQSKQLVQAAANLAATFGGSLDSNVEKLGKTFSGQAGRLAQYIPELKNLTEEQLKAGAAFEIVNQKFSGASANELNTYGGRVTAAKNAFSDLQEEMGRFVIENGYVNGALELAKTSFMGLIAAQRAANELFGLQSNAISEQRQKSAELGAEYNKLGESLASLNKLKQASIDSYKDTGEASSLQYVQEYTKGIVQIEARRNEILKERQGLRTKDIADQSAAAAAENKTKAITDSPIDPEIEKKAIQTRLDTYSQLEIARADYNARQVETDVLGQQITEENYAFELQRLQDAEAMKIEAVYAAEEAKAALITDSRTRQFSQLKIATDKEAALEKSSVETKKKIDSQQVALEQQKQAAMAGAALAGLNLLGTIAKDGSREQFLIQKAAAIGSAAMAAKVAYMQALAFPPGPPATIPTASWVAAAGVANVAAIVATSLKGFESGGIVSGNSMSGDRIGIRVNSGEMILNRQQQTSLFNSINNGSSKGDSSQDTARIVEAIMSQPINLVVDGRAIATVVRNEINSGFRMP